MTKFNAEMISANKAQNALDTACYIVQKNLPHFTHNCQNHSSVKNIYPKCENTQWTCGFWPGEVWLAFENTADDAFKKAALILSDSFDERIRNKVEVDHHDMGFLYTPTCVAAYKLVGDEKARKAAILAADQLCSRFHKTGGFLQAWGEMGAKENYRYIIDCLLNLPLLYWAHEQTGDEKYTEIAYTHITTCLANSIREDGSTYHTFYMDPVTGTPVGGVTCQGYSNDSSWARGQAWGLYGVALSYTYTKKEEYKEIFDKVLNYYLSRLPEDMIPYWDMIFTQGDEPRDSSSAAIVACGLLEMAKHVSDDKARDYKNLAAQMLNSLCDNYAVQFAEYEEGIGLVKHGTYSKKSPYNTCTPEGVDECVSWGDYFYMEALTRYVKDWNMYW